MLSKEIKEVYNSLQDQHSKRIFRYRFQAYLTGDSRYILMEDNLEMENMLFSNCKYVFWGNGENAKFAYNFLKDSLPIIGFTETDKIDLGLLNLPFFSTEKLLADSNIKILFAPQNDYLKKLRRLIKKISLDRIITFKTNQKKQYFDLHELHWNEDYVYLDGGSFNGDTIIDFLTWCNGKYKKIYAFEPDMENFNDLKKRVIEYSIPNIEIYNLGLWSEATRLKFDNTHSIASKISTIGHNLIDVNVNSIDNLLNGSSINYIKLDVEGAEIQALKGAYYTIRQYKPQLAVSIYHKNNDFLELPLFIKSNFPFYQFYIRKYSPFSAETILYALPNG